MFIESMLSRFIYYPDRTLTANPRMLNMAYENVRIAAEDNVTIHGWFVPCANPVAAVLFLHGNAGNISHRLANVQMLVERLRCQVLIVDYRGYGESDGAPSERGIYRDAHAAWRWLCENAAGPHIVFGRSLGGAVALHVAVLGDPRPDGVIVENTFTRLTEIAAQMVPFPTMIGMLPDLYPSIDRIGKVESPLLVIHSEHDELIPLQHGQLLHAAAPEPKMLYIVRGGHHNDAYMIGGEAYRATWRQFLDGVRAD